MTYVGRCVSSCRVIPNAVWVKRCVRAAGHAEAHLWVESFDRSDGLPLIVAWSGASDVNEPDVTGDVVLRGAL